MNWLFGDSKPVLGEPLQEKIEYGKSHTQPLLGTVHCLPSEEKR